MDVKTKPPLTIPNGSVQMERPNDEESWPSGKAEFLAKIRYLKDERRKIVEEALDFASKSHNGQLRRSGKPFIEHPIATASYLAGIEMDVDTLTAALLHDTVEDCGVEPEELELRFGRSVRFLVESVTKIVRLESSFIDIDNTKPKEGEAARRRRISSLRRVLVSTAGDVRVILIKFADRLHNIQTLQYMPEHKRIQIATETMDIYAPLANRLGISDIKWRLEDEAFKHLNPSKYKAISRLISGKRDQREQYTSQLVASLKDAIAKDSMSCEIYGRPKHLYSVYRKFQRYKEMGRKFDDIYDLIALRVIMETKTQCYTALGIIHEIWPPVPGSFDDYIAQPKDNNYQSLHTAVKGEDQRPFEIQIRTREMDEIAEEGIAAHSIYKEGKASLDKKSKSFEGRMKRLRSILEGLRVLQEGTTSDDEYLEGVRTDILSDSVFVYTPQGEVKDLPAGSTPLDFAYSVHTELGHSCTGARINGKMGALRYRLQNGDTVEIINSRNRNGPSLDWLNPGLSYLKSSAARHKVRSWFRKRERPENIKRGKEIIKRETRRFGTVMTEEEISSMLNYANSEDLSEALGSGKLSVWVLTSKLSETTSAAYQLKKHSERIEEDKRSEIVVMGGKGLHTRFPECCQAEYGDDIVGYLTKGRGVTIHKADCGTIFSIKDVDNFVSVAWGHSSSTMPARIFINASDRLGLVRDITDVLMKERINLHSIKTNENTEGSSSTIELTMYTKRPEQLGRAITKIGQVPGITGITRIE